MSVYDWDYAPKFPYVTPGGIVVMSTTPMTDKELVDLDVEMAEMVCEHHRDDYYEDAAADGYEWERRALSQMALSY